MDAATVSSVFDSAPRSTPEPVSGADSGPELAPEPVLLPQSTTPDAEHRSAVSMSQGKSALASMGLALVAIIVAFLLILSKSFAAVPVAIGAIGFSCGAYGRHRRHMDFKALWKKWPHAEAEKSPNTFNDEMVAIAGSGTGWITAMLVGLVTATLLIVGWAVVEQQYMLAFLGLVFGATVGWAAKSTLESEAALVLGSNADIEATLNPFTGLNHDVPGLAASADQSSQPVAASTDDQWDDEWAPITS